MNVTFDVEFSVQSLARRIAELDHPTILALFKQVLDHAATAELDEELIARTWRGLEGCYAPDEQPTFEQILASHPA